MKLYRFLASLIDIAILSGVFFTLLGILSFLDVYSVLIVSILEFIFIYYIFGVHDGLGKVLFGLENSNKNLTAKQRLIVYPPTLIFIYQSFISLLYPFLVLIFGNIGIILMAGLYVGVALVSFIILVFFILDIDFWNYKCNNKIINRRLKL